MAAEGTNMVVMSSVLVTCALISLALAMTVYSITGQEIPKADDEDGNYFPWQSALFILVSPVIVGLIFQDGLIAMVAIPSASGGAMAGTWTLRRYRFWKSHRT